ncbi:MAG: 50S ribosomal protein L35 [Patescibacteria group bacterium]|nr:50S ribosomal protein L35 [Patescibacteria group bacterium]
MNKIKTHKATAKRFKKTKSGKVVKRACGQSHFNAKESGNTRRNKRKAVTLSESFHGIIDTNLMK